MAVIVSDNRNASYNGKLSTASSFYRAEAWNLGAHNQTAYLTLSTRRAIDVTFANAGNCQGIELLIISINASIDRDIRVMLQEAKAVSSFNTTTERVNSTGHGLTSGMEVTFTSTGTLPSGITSNASYFVINETANDFQISLTPGGSAVLLSGTPTGTATCWVMRADNTTALNDIFGPFPTDADMTIYEKYNYAGGFVPFKFATPYAVDVTANKWRFLAYQLNGTTGTWNLGTSNATAPFYVTWCDTAISHTDGDTLIVVDKVTIDKTYTITGLLGTGDTVNSTAGVISRSLDGLPLLEWENPAAASYTMTLKGDLLMGTHSIFHAGTLASPIATANAGTIYFDAPAVGTTATSRIFYPLASNSTTTVAGIKGSLSIVGEVPAVPATTLAADALTGQANIVTTDATGWAVNDYVVIGKQDIMGQGSVILHQIQSISGTNITLTANLATANRLAGATVVRFGGYGMKLTGKNTTNAGRIALLNPSNYAFKGCEVTDVRVENIVASGTYFIIDSAAERSKHIYTDNVARYTGTTNYGFIKTLLIPKLGAEVERNYVFRGEIVRSISGYSNRNQKSGICTIKNNVNIANYADINFSVLQSTTKCDIQDNKIENSYRYGISLGGLNTIFKNNSLWGISSTAASLYYALQIGTLINPIEISGNSIDKSDLAVFINGTSINCVDHGFSFGQTATNVVDIVSGAGSIIDYTFDSPIGNLTIDDQYMPDTVAGSELRFLNFDSTTNRDRVYTPYGSFYRTGYGLADTTVWTGSTFGAASPDQFALRMRSNGTESLEYVQSKTLGSILGLTMTVSCRIKINTAAYYAGVHTLPTLRVIYDNGTEITDVATATTDPQQLLVSFIPTTDAASIRVIIETLTDAVDTDADVYVGQVLIPPPEGTSVDTQNLGSWVDAMPLPSVSTIPAPGTPWNEAADAYTVAGTMGAAVHIINRNVQKASKLIPATEEV
jgi:hypothetical protein